MSDTIRGPVTKIVDGDTFEMKVTHTGKKNTRKYNPKEAVRLAGVDAPEISTPEGKAAKKKLSTRLSGREVRCSVQARDKYGRVVATVRVV